MPLATAITSRTGGRSLAMALRTQNFVRHFLLPPVSPHEDMGRDAISTTRLMSRAAASVRESAKQAQLALDSHTFRKFNTQFARVHCVDPASKVLAPAPSSIDAKNDFVRKDDSNASTTTQRMCS